MRLDSHLPSRARSYVRDAVLYSVPLRDARKGGRRREATVLTVSREIACWMAGLEAAGRGRS